MPSRAACAASMAATRRACLCCDKTIFTGTVLQCKKKRTLSTIFGPRTWLDFHTRGRVAVRVAIPVATRVASYSQDITMPPEGAAVKAKVLGWCQEKTRGYSGVQLSTSWSRPWNDGIALCALLHAHFPEDIGDFETICFDTTSTLFRNYIADRPS